MEHPRGQDTYHDGGTLATTEFGSLLGDLMMRRQAHRGDQGGAIPEVPETSARLDHGRMTDMKTLSSVITIA
jgi:hypothetical protein